MHLLLTDRLACPRCGPAFGLILLSDRMEDRRVLEGALGCPNCRERYPVREGAADLRPPPRGPAPTAPASPAAPDAGETMRLAAMLGITEGPAHVLAAGEALHHAPALARLIPELEVIVVEPQGIAWEESPGVTRMHVGDILPLQSRSLKGVILGGEAVDHLLGEGIRVLGSGGRIVVLGRPQGVGRRLVDAGLGLLLDQAGATVATRR